MKRRIPRVSRIIQRRVWVHQSSIMMSSPLWGFEVHSVPVFQSLYGRTLGVCGIYSTICSIVPIVIKWMQISHDLPSLARPITSLGLGTRVGTVMSGTEGLPACGVVFLDGHFGVTKTDNLRFTASLYINGRLLRTARSPEGSVEGNLLAVLGSHITSCPYRSLCLDSSWIHAYRHPCRA